MREFKKIYHLLPHITKKCAKRDAFSSTFKEVEPYLWLLAPMKLWHMLISYGVAAQLGILRSASLQVSDYCGSTCSTAEYVGLCRWRRTALGCTCFCVILLRYYEASVRSRILWLSSCWSRENWSSNLTLNYFEITLI